LEATREGLASSGRGEVTAGQPLHGLKLGLGKLRDVVAGVLKGDELPAARRPWC